LTVTDPVFNEPLPTSINGQDYTVRELPNRRVRQYVMRYFAVAMKARTLPALRLDGAAKTEAEIQAMLEAIDPSILVNDYWDLANSFIAEASGLTTEQVEDMPTSVVLALADVVWQVHKVVVSRFFHVKGAVVEVIRPGDVRTNGHSGRPSSSPSLSGADSTTTP
jgi:hypothetical protein